MGLVDRFDETLLLLADLTGLQHLLYARSAPQSTNTKMEPPTIDAMCPDLDACKRHISAVAPVDKAIYMEAVAAFDAKVKALGAPFQERLKQFRAVQQASAERPRKDRAKIARRSTAYEHMYYSTALRNPNRVNMEGVGCRFGETKEAWELCKLIVADTSQTRHWLFTPEGCCERLRTCCSASRRLKLRDPGRCRGWDDPGWRKSTKRGRVSGGWTDEECARECSLSPDWDKALTQAGAPPPPLRTPHPLPCLPLPHSPPSPYPPPPPPPPHPLSF